MDFDFSSLTQAFNQVKNAVMNYTEYEIKVRDATNNDPWGASSTLMNEIASATWHFSHFSEIMTTIFKRLEESSSGEWRKVYKALQLLEFLLKNGSDNVLDSVRTHSRDIGVLESFHYIDEKGKDQGINVRLRAKEILQLVNHPAKLEEERVKAKENKSKYTGVSSTGLSFSSNFSGQTHFSSNQSTFSQQSFTSPNKSESLKKTTSPPALKKTTPPPVQQVDLLNFDDVPAQVVKVDVENHDDWGEFTAASSSKSPLTPVTLTAPLSVGATITNNNDDFGDFGDFTSAAPATQKESTRKNSIFAESFTPLEKEENTLIKDPFSKLVNLDSLGSCQGKHTGPSLADLAKNKI